MFFFIFLILVYFIVYKKKINNLKKKGQLKQIKNKINKIEWQNLRGFCPHMRGIAQIMLAH